MKDKDIMDIEVYQIKSNKWQIIKEEKNIILKLLAYKLSSWADDTYLKVIINKETKLKNIIIEWNCADLVFETHKTFFKFDNELLLYHHKKHNNNDYGRILLQYPKLRMEFLN